MDPQSGFGGLNFDALIAIWSSPVIRLGGNHEALPLLLDGRRPFVAVVVPKVLARRVVAMTQIGEPQRTDTYEPIIVPVPEPVPVKAPIETPVKEPVGVPA
jgi:hypothetical protein